MFFYYEKMATGNWQAVKSINEPAIKGANGVLPEFCYVIKLKPLEDSLSIDSLKVLYPFKEFSNE